jgi:hypothetical protein
MIALFHENVFLLSTNKLIVNLFQSQQLYNMILRLLWNLGFQDALLSIHKSHQKLDFRDDNAGLC